MPFTFSHPALVLPFTSINKKYYSFTGLIVGSITPDFEYFIRLSPESIYSHTWLGLLWFDLPLALLISIVYHQIVRNAFIDNLPLGIKLRLSPFRSFNWLGHLKANWLITCISIMVGTATHIFWDDFTHEYGYFVKIIPVLNNSMVLFGIKIPMYEVFQHLSTLIGGIAMGWLILQYPKNEIPTHHSTKYYWFVVGFITLAVMIIGFISGIDYRLFDNLIITAMSAGLISLVITPLFIKQKPASNLKPM